MCPRSTLTFAAMQIARIKAGPIFATVFALGKPGEWVHDVRSRTMICEQARIL
jgi:hypothetical protein